MAPATSMGVDAPTRFEEAAQMSARSIRRAHRRRVAIAGAAIGAGVALLPAPAAAATFTVTNNADSGPGSLRQAVTAANGTTPHDTINFAPNVTGTITLAGRITVTRSATIDGPGAAILRIVAPTDNAFFQNDTLPMGINVEFEGLTLEGHSSGSGSSGGGLVIGSGDTSTVRNCVVSGGTAANEGGGISVNRTTLKVIDSTITGNTAGTSGGGIFATDSAVQVSGSTLSGNNSAEGGAIALAEGSGTGLTSLAVTDSKITANGATSDGGGISVASADGPTSVARTTISGNVTSGAGGGLYFGYGSSLAIDSSTFSGNVAAEGGGLEIYAPSGPSVISDTTIASNSTLGSGGGIYSFGYFDKAVRVQNSTVAANFAGGAGGGIFRFGYDGTPPGYEGPDEIALSSTIVTGNTGSGGADLADGPLADDSFVADHSIIGSTAGATVTESAPGANQLNIGALPLAPLADNGGPTPTMLPELGGPAIDAGAANGLTLDQRGLARTVQQPGGSAGDGTDVGAVELGDARVDGAEVDAKRKQRTKGKKVVVTVEVTAAEDVTAVASGTVKVGKKKLALGEVSRSVVAGQDEKVKLKPGKGGARKVSKALGSGRKAKASVTVEFTDAAGNAVSLPAKVTLKAGKRKTK